MIGGTKQNVPIIYELENFDQHKKKFVITGGTKKNMIEVCGLEKLDPCKKKSIMMEDIRLIVPRAYE